jgi:hypothetical protein
LSHSPDFGHQCEDRQAPGLFGEIKRFRVRRGRVLRLWLPSPRRTAPPTSNAPHLMVTYRRAEEVTAQELATSGYGRYCCKSHRGTARPGKFGNNRIRMAGSVNQNSRFDLGVRKVFFIPAPKIVLQQYRPEAADLCVASKVGRYPGYTGRPANDHFCRSTIG